jgi:hypothetical protein
MNNALLSLLQTVLGEGTVRSTGDVCFHCPFCNHHKKKLEVNLDTGQWHCWVCDAKGRRLPSLFLRHRVPDHKLQRLRELIGSFVSAEARQAPPPVALPEDYRPLWEPSRSMFYRICHNYLEERGVRPADILRYRIGYCEKGQYAKMVIIPNYDQHGQLNYFSARSFTTNKKLGPSLPKNIIGFDLQINWSEPVTIIEGQFDALAVRYNACPLYGSTISEALKIRILESEVPLNICLDPDAFKKTLSHIEYFLGNGIPVNLVRLPEGYDPSKLGHEAVWRYIREAEPVLPDRLFSYQIGLKLHEPDYEDFSHS